MPYLAKLIADAFDISEGVDDRSHKIYDILRILQIRAALYPDTRWNSYLVILLNDNRLFPRKGFFVIALQRRDLGTVKFLQERIHLNIHEFRFEDGKLALHYLYDEEKYRAEYRVSGTKVKELVDYFLENSVKNHVDDQGYGYLHAACMTGNVAAVRRFISQGVNVNVNTWRFSPLYVAVKFRQLDVVKILLDHGATGVQSIEWSLHALAWSRCLCECKGYCRSCDFKKPVDEIVDLLIKKGANIEARDQYGVSPLQAAVARFDVELTRSLLRHGANINSLNEDTMFARDFEEIELRSIPFTVNIIKTIELLQSAGFRFNVITRHRMIQRWKEIRPYNEILVKKDEAEALIRLQLEFFAADLFMTDYCKLNLPHVICRKVAEKMSTGDLLRLCEQTDEENLVQPLPKAKRPRLC